MTFGTRLKGLLQRRGFTQETFAEAVGVSQSAVSDWVRDEKLPEGKFLVQFPGLLEVSGHWLLTGTGPEALPGAPQASDMAFAAAMEDIRRKVLAAVESALAPTPSASPDRIASAMSAGDSVNAVRRERESPGKGRRSKSG